MNVALPDGNADIENQFVRSRGDVIFQKVPHAAMGMPPGETDVIRCRLRIMIKGFTNDDQQQQIY
ncbi:hypothetical protein DSCA_63120 [Desulfosarcina alkanivorans]|jgi:hypothetical protein|uniref:Uncharacterized protein n=1 Tax=Desulfosarcina alkanivorans TaxID=571177 RepID=A0A5K7YRF9_9BACT|nr:hypothetical protein [Desulfosarcina alkanivorans]BBO72382.1 hypothetical protein DSCA_63120 [Desulfosarcina alkanivorans]